MSEMLFEGAKPLQGAARSPERDVRQAPARLERANRAQVVLHPSDVDSLLPEDHRARAVWDFVMGLDLTDFYARIGSREGGAGRAAIDPAILLCLWLYAVVDGVGSARGISRLCEAHDAYRWICGGVSVHHDTLSAFRNERPAEIDALLTQIVGALMAEGLVRLERVAQDGMKVRASAGAASFRRKAKLERCMAQAKKRVEALRKEIADDPSATERRRKERELQQARRRQERVKKALAAHERHAAKKSPKEREKVRASTTDDEARVMKMADGGFRPAFNGQYATDTASQVIVGVDVVQAGNDAGLMPPMIEQIERRTHALPGEYLVDGGYNQHDSIDAAAAKRVVVYAPPPEPRCGSTRDPSKPQPDDSDAVAAWRVRMATPEAKEIYKHRAATAECVNAIARNRGLQRLLVRGQRKVKTVFTLFAIAHDLMRAITLRATMAAPA
jgi:transposase